MVTRSLTGLLLLLAPVMSAQTKWLDISGDPLPFADDPAVLDFSTPSVTCMDFVEKGKVIDAFPGDAERRAKLARRVSDALTCDVLFSEKEDALFHGNPHAGNVFHAENAVGDPCRKGIWTTVSFQWLF